MLARCTTMARCVAWGFRDFCSLRISKFGIPFFRFYTEWCSQGTTQRNTRRLGNPDQGIPNFRTEGLSAIFPCRDRMDYVFWRVLLPATKAVLTWHLWHIVSSLSYVRRRWAHAKGMRMSLNLVVPIFLLRIRWARASSGKSQRSWLLFYTVLPQRTWTSAHSYHLRCSSRISSWFLELLLIVRRSGLQCFVISGVFKASASPWPRITSRLQIAGLLYTWMCVADTSPEG